MTVYVASTPISSLTGVSGLVLGFIDGGTQWLGWATNPATPASYHFEDESALVAGVQTGLHASPLLLMPGLALMVSPLKLMTIGLADLQTLAAAEAGTGGAVVATTTPQILADHALVTQSALAAGPAFLEQLGVAGAPVFQCMGLNDQLAILALLPRSGDEEPPSTDLLQEAAAFGVAEGRTPIEFCDYYDVYLRVAATGAPSGETAKQRTARATTAVNTLLPLLFDALNCPRVVGLVPPWEVAAAIDEWLMMGRQLGFSRLSLGVQQVVANTDFLQTGDDAKRIVDAYLASAQALLKRATLGRGQMGQDGASCTFPVRWGNEEAIIALGADGIITLGSYRRLPPPQPATAPSPTKPETK